MGSVVDAVRNNEFLHFIQNDVTDSKKLIALKEAGIKEAHSKMQQRYQKQVNEQEKEKSALIQQYKGTFLISIFRQTRSKR